MCVFHPTTAKLERRAPNIATTSVASDGSSSASDGVSDALWWRLRRSQDAMATADAEALLKFFRVRAGPVPTPAVHSSLNSNWERFYSGSASRPLCAGSRGDRGGCLLKRLRGHFAQAQGRVRSSLSLSREVCSLLCHSIALLNLASPACSVQPCVLSANFPAGWLPR